MSELRRSVRERVLLALAVMVLAVGLVTLATARQGSSDRLAAAPTRPPAPTGVVVSLSGTTASVAFTPGSDGGSPITNYTALCSSSDGGPNRAATALANPLTVLNLTLTKTYTCKVRANNAVGAGYYSPSSPAFNSNNSPPAAPESVGILNQEDATGGTISFTAGADGGSAITSFTATCSSWNGGATKAVTGPGSPLYINNLTVGLKTYRCSVTATNALGTSPSSPPSPSFTTWRGPVTTTPGLEISPHSLTANCVVDARGSVCDPVASGTVTNISGAASEPVNVSVFGSWDQASTGNTIPFSSGGPIVCAASLAPGGSCTYSFKPFGTAGIRSVDGPVRVSVDARAGQLSAPTVMDSVNLH